MESTSAGGGGALLRPPLFPGPVRRPRDASDDFFFEGDSQRAKWSRRPGTQQWNSGRVPDNDDDAVLASTNAIHCATAGCHQTFQDGFSYELHFNAAHRNVCRICRRIFVSARLLDIHVLETHDTLFKVMAESERMYACLVEGCERKFMTAEKRHMHLVDAHRFSRTFRFERPTASTHASQARRGSSFPTSIAFGRGARKAFHSTRHQQPLPPRLEQAHPPLAAASVESEVPAGPNRRERREQARLAAAAHPDAMED